MAKFQMDELWASRFPEEFGCLIEPRVALLLNHLRSVRDRLLHELSPRRLWL